ncbi:MAG: hypothetical protein K2Y37_07075 [Pirellulales bacterium]|nr:hypothetical protein [Pirellulales bacterium]
MPFLIGIDEAGYGPNLGPLVIAATLWRIDGPLPDDDQLDARVAQVISRQAPRARRALVKAGAATDAVARSTAARRVRIADSKAIYKPHLGLAPLELNVLAMSTAAGALPTDCLAFWQTVAPQAVPHRDAEVWNREFNPQLPLEADARTIARLGQRVAAGLEVAGLRFLGARATVLFPAQFNQCVADAGSKGAALSHLSVALMAECLATCRGGEVIRVLGDKHGGRHYYGPLLQHQFPEWLVEVHDEGAARSLYRFGPPERRVEVVFRARGERSLPTALASMFAKYLRELSMRAFNKFWCARVPQLRPTAGYPGDAQRFKRAIAGAQAELGIDDAALWRSR